MRAKQLEAILGSEFRIGEAEMVQRFQKLRDMRLLPVSRGRNAEDIDSDAIASGLLCVVSERLGFAGLMANVLRRLRPVGGARAAFAEAETFAEALVAILENQALLAEIAEIRVTDGEIYTNCHGRGTIIYRNEGHEHSTYYVGGTALSLFQPGMEKHYDPRESISSMIRETVMFPRVLTRITQCVRESERFSRVTQQALHSAPQPKAAV
jgi:hypothetical protein